VSTNRLFLISVWFYILLGKKKWKKFLIFKKVATMKKIMYIFSFWIHIFHAKNPGIWLGLYNVLSCVRELPTYPLLIFIKTCFYTLGFWKFNNSPHPLIFRCVVKRLYCTKTHERKVHKYSSGMSDAPWILIPIRYLKKMCILYLFGCWIK